MQVCDYVILADVSHMIPIIIIGVKNIDSGDSIEFSGGTVAKTY